MERIVVDIAAGTTTVVPLTQEEIAAAQAQQAAWDAQVAQIVSKPSLEETIAQLQAELAALKAAQP